MNDINKSTWEYCKSFCGLLKERKIWPACREFYNIFRSFYLNRLKGKYVNVRGRKIPLTAILVVVLIGAYYVMPSNIFGGNGASHKAQIESNTYDKDGLRVYDLKKCNMGACGLVENGSENSFERIRVKIIFYTHTGQPIAVGIADALEMAPRTRVQFQIPCSDEFAYFKLDDVLINPDIDEEEEARIRQSQQQASEPKEEPKETAEGAEAADKQ